MNNQSSPEQASSLCEALRIVDDAWEELRRTPYVQQKLRVIPVQLAEVSLAEAERRSEVGQSILRRLEMLEQRELPHDLALTLRLVRHRARSWAREADWYWIAVDPIGFGFFGLFLPTAYCGGWLLNIVHSQFTSFTFAESGDFDRYLGLVADYARLIDQFAERTAGQAERGIRIPKAQVWQARGLLAGFKSQVRAVVMPAVDRLAALPAGELLRELERRIAQNIEPAFDRALEGLSEAYLAQAPDSVGVSQYINGSQIYQDMIRLQTTLDLTPQQIHVYGEERIGEIEASMKAIRAELGFRGEHAEFLDYLSGDPRWSANTVEGVTAVFQRYIDRIALRFDEYFPAAPRATCSVAPLPKALESSMTYGYYDAPRANRDQGVYLFNAANLTKQALVHICALTYHELIPGHHLHFSLQQENDAFHPFRKQSFVNAYNEGWAEYVATFLGDVGLYKEPEERYGRLMMEAILSTRLVVDTGMNALGWSLERAREYMRRHSCMSESEIQTESLRYSCDIPGQALAYKLGDTQILALRERMRSALGAQFDIREFHGAIMRVGTLPLPDLEWHLEYELKRAQSALTEHDR